MCKIIILCFILLIASVQVKTDCNVVSKAEWGGITPTKVEYLPRPVNLVIIEHTATTTCNTDSGCESLAQSIQDQHMEWFSDIGMSFLVGGNGKVYEGTGWLHVGAHTIGYNRKSIGISFAGNFIKELPTAAALEAVKKLISCGVEQGHLSPDYKIVGHRQLIAIESPGRKLYNEIRSWPNWTDDVAQFKTKK